MNSKVGASKYPYSVDYNDHFETPLRAYTDVFPVIETLIQQKCKGKRVIIYDPFYCTGRAASLLRQCLQSNNEKLAEKVDIQHEKRDFYRDLRENTVPKFDILVTNPPYSGDHKERCLEFAVNSSRPFFLLMPNYIATKEYFRKTVLETKKVQDVYIIPSPGESYEYHHPEGTGKPLSPFESVWFVGVSRRTSLKPLRESFVGFHSKQSTDGGSRARIATSLDELIRIGGASGAKRKNPRQRRKMKQAAKLANEGRTCEPAQKNSLSSTASDTEVDKKRKSKSCGNSKRKKGHDERCIHK